jgi:hypothetical protein
MIPQVMPSLARKRSPAERRRKVKEKGRRMIFLFPDTVVEPKVGDTQIQMMASLLQTLQPIELYHAIFACNKQYYSTTICLPIHLQSFPVANMPYVFPSGSPEKPAATEKVTEAPEKKAAAPWWQLPRTFFLHIFLADHAMLIN